MSERYQMRAAHAFNQLTRLVIGNEVRMGDTVAFMSEVDLGEIEAIRDRCERAKRPSYTAFVAKAVALALLEFPYANQRLVRSWLPFMRGRMQQFTTCDIAIAVERDVPGTSVATFADVLRDVDQLPLSDINDRLRALGQCDESTNKQWRDYKWAVCHLPAWLASFIISLPVFIPRLWSKWRGGAVMISAPCKYGVETIVGAWTSPLGVSFGLVKERAVVIDGRVTPRPTFNLTLNFDRRVMAGAQAARFFKRIVELLERGEGLLASQADGESSSAVKPAMLSA